MFTHTVEGLIQSGVIDAYKVGEQMHLTAIALARQFNSGNDFEPFAGS